MSNEGTLRLAQLEKYNTLPNPPAPNPDWLSELGSPEEESNTWVDLWLLTAITSPLADYLVTDDEKLRRRATRFGLGGSVLSIEAALEFVRGLFDALPPPAPNISQEQVHQLSTNDPIFDSLRGDYADFDKWLMKCAAEMRRVFVVRAQSDPAIAGLAIINREDRDSRKTLKVCTLKVSAQHLGLRYGELLLKQVFEFASKNQYKSIFVEAFAKQTQLIELLTDFGFINQGEKAISSECVYSKNLVPTVKDLAATAPVDVNRLFGPRIFDTSRVATFIVPIKPRPPCGALSRTGTSDGDLQQEYGVWKLDSQGIPLQFEDYADLSRRCAPFLSVNIFARSSNGRDLRGYASFVNARRDREVCRSKNRLPVLRDPEDV